MAPKNGSAKQKKTFEKIKKGLVRKKQLILEGANEAITSQLVKEKENLPELGDQASAEIDNNFLLRLKGREKKLLAKIDQALERIDNGTFGICEECGQAIGLKRLEARPVTTMCIECKTDQEEKEKIKKT
ncbi:MAG: RNA polymerase-binding protein DksA [Deltaproteobacteria bacterium]|nr:RNA polymerase-binding protein DksA [Deltaproteobacteria bacterium]